MRCIYVVIGQKGFIIAGVRAPLEDAGALEYTTIVAALRPIRPGSCGCALHRLGYRSTPDVRRASTS